MAMHDHHQSEAKLKVENEWLLTHLHQTQEALEQSYQLAKQKNAYIIDIEQRLEKGQRIQPITIAWWQKITDKLGYTSHMSIAEIRQSGYLDAEWYWMQYPDVQQARLDPAVHYFNYGWREGRHPSMRFNTQAYLDAYPDVEKSGMNPLLHFIRFGMHEGRHIVALKRSITSPVLREIEVFKKNAQQALKKLQRAQQEVISLQHERDTLRHLAEAVDSFKAEVEHLRVQLDAYRQKGDEQQRLVELQQKENMQLIEQSANMQMRLQSLQYEAASVLEEKHLLQLQLAQKGKELKSLEDELARLGSAMVRVTQLESEASMLNQEKQLLEQKLAKTTDDFSSLQSKFSSLELENRDAANALKAAKTETDLLLKNKQALIASGDTMESFLYHCQKLFYGKALTFVDVGAFNGEFAKDVISSGLRIHEAHLFEAEADNFLTLEKNMAAVEKKPRQLVCYPFAVSDCSGVLSLNPKKNMSQIVTAVMDADTKLAQVEAVTLDQMMNRFTDEHISLLKIDVEGHEMHVLRGASTLLQKQKVDMVYIEAGLKPEGGQQCYYRLIDDVMLSNGYRLFRIFEQQYEWLSDSPVLRRFNLAYLSESFANTVPVRVVDEVYMLKTQYMSHDKKNG